MMTHMSVCLCEAFGRHWKDVKALGLGSAKAVLHADH